MITCRWRDGPAIKINARALWRGSEEVENWENLLRREEDCSFLAYRLVDSSHALLELECYPP